MAAKSISRKITRHHEEESESESESESDHLFTYAYQLVTSSALPVVLKSAIQLQLFDIIAKAGPGAQLSPSQIVSLMPEVTNPNAAGMIDRMLRLLVSHSVLTCSVVQNGDDVQRLYGLAPVAKYLGGEALGPLMELIQDKVFIESWHELTDAVREGGVPFDRAHGTHAFDYPGLDPRFNEVFNKAMIGHTKLLMKQILQKYKGFAHINKLVDVGGGLGVNLSIIISKHPTITGINFDLPHVIEHAPTYGGLEHFGGDMFESVPEGDAVFMKWILYDWSDDQCLKLLKNCYKSLPEDGKVIVVEALLPVTPDTSSSFISTTQCDIIMMTQNPGGKERSEKEFLTLAIGAGFKGIKLCCSAFNFWVIEFFK